MVMNSQTGMDSRWSWILRQGRQFSRFMAVGLLNTGIDLGLTNLLVLLFNPATGIGLLGISIFACTVATLNSYLLNRRWTFRDGAGSSRREELVKFFLVAGLSMAINTSVFLFLTSRLGFWLPDPLPLLPALSRRMVIINVAKVCGVGTAFVVSFLGYRLGVFKTDSIRNFRETYIFTPAAASQIWPAAVWLTVFALLFRMTYGWASNPAQWWTVLPGDRGGIQIVCSSLLIAVVVWIAGTVYSIKEAWLAGLFTVVHPRLIQYAGDLSGESVVILVFTLATAGWIAGFRSGNRLPGLIWGGALGAGAWWRPELVYAFLAGFMLEVILKHLRIQPAPPEGKPPAAPVFRFLPGKMLTAAGVAFAISGTAGLLIKGALASSPLFGLLSWRTGSGVMQLMEQLPAMLASPVVLFLLLLPLLAGRWHLPSGERRPLVFMLFFPAVFFGLMAVEPHYLTSMIIPLNIFGAAGLSAFTSYAERESRIPRLLPVLAAGTAGFSLLILAWRIWR